MKKDRGEGRLLDRIRGELTELVNEEYGKPKGVAISLDYPLLERGVIDSLSIMSLLIKIEQKYNLDFYKIDVTRDSFRDIESIAHMTVSGIVALHGLGENPEAITRS